MFENVTKWIVLLVSVGALIACDEDKATGDSHAGANSEECHLEGFDYKCTESNPLVGPVGGIIIDGAIFGDGEVEEILWEKTASWFLKSDKHLYGFDVDPLALLPDYAENGQDVYISVQKGESALLRVYVDPDAKKDYRLHKIDNENKIIQENVFTGLDICEEENCIKEVQLPPGDYAVYYGSVDKKRYVHVIEYDLDTKMIDFVQFGDADNSTCYYGAENGCYTRENVEERFNEIYKQAVVNGHFNERKSSEFGFDDAMYVDLTNSTTTQERMLNYVLQIKKTLDPNFKTRYENYTDLLLEQQNLIAEAAAKKIEKNTCTQSCAEVNKAYSDLQQKVQEMRNKVNNTSMSFMMYLSHNVNWNDHVVFGINEMSIGWDLSRDGTGQDYALKNYCDYNRACTIYHKREYDDGCLNLRFPMYIKNNCDGFIKEIEAEMYAFDKETNIFYLNLYNTGVISKGCDYTIFANVHPFVPGSPYAVQYAAQVTSKKHNGWPTLGGAIIGGLVWGSHVSGENSLNVINHEIGHLYGLSDIFVSESDPTFSSGKSTDETNLMNYTIPIGPKIRYRPSEAVYTSSNERIKKNGKYATERQWECARSADKCVIQ